MRGGEPLTNPAIIPIRPPAPTLEDEMRSLIEFRDYLAFVQDLYEVRCKEFTERVLRRTGLRHANAEAHEIATEHLILELFAHDREPATRSGQADF
ncbi:MAG: hypothetical protein ABFD89_06480 [Bryobacteraceae bacterium]